MGFLKKLWDKLTSFLKKLWDELRPLLAIIAIALIVYFSFGGALTLFAGGFTAFGLTFGAITVGGPLAAVIAGGAAYLLDDEITTDFVEGVSEAIGSTVGAITRGLVKGVTGGNFLTYAAIGLGAWFLFKQVKQDDDTNEVPTGEGQIDSSQDGDGLPYDLDDDITDVSGFIEDGGAYYA